MEPALSKHLLVKPSALHEGSHGLLTASSRWNGEHPHLTRNQSLGGLATCDIKLSGKKEMSPILNPTLFTSMLHAPKYFQPGPEDDSVSCCKHENLYLIPSTHGLAWGLAESSRPWGLHGQPA